MRCGPLHLRQIAVIAACGLLAGVAWMAPADETNLCGPDTTNDVAREEPTPHIRNYCPDLPESAVPLDYTILARLEFPIDPEMGIDPESLSDQLTLDCEAEYRRVFGEESSGIDWEFSRILVVEEFASRSRYGLDSEVVLSGIYTTGESVIVSQTSTNYGPCQGIAQDSTGFSVESSYLIVALPREPAAIVYHLCTRGECPPDIP